MFSIVVNTTCPATNDPDVTTLYPICSRQFKMLIDVVGNSTLLRRIKIKVEQCWSKKGWTFQPQTDLKIRTFWFEKEGRWGCDAIQNTEHRLNPEYQKSAVPRISKIGWIQNIKHKLNQVYKTSAEWRILNISWIKYNKHQLNQEY